jgi:hypothetical protein
MRHLTLATALLIGLASAPASAAILYEQPTGGAGTWTSQTGPNGQGFQTFDSFSLGAGATITDVRWRGGVLTFGAAPATPINLIAFNIQFWSDAAGAPGALISSTTAAFGDVTRSFRGVETATGAQIPLEVFEFTTDITPFAAVAGTTYWLSILADSPTFDPFFVWRPGLGPDGESVQDTLGVGGVPIGRTTRGGDRAFALADGPIDIPLPASAPLLLTALLGLGLVRRKAR